ncbi:efflux RND transporter periplasmic adaptor subunit [Gloeocapsopsis dulcis]|uniref:Efflux transporter periplasmic adaptor subunit n=1 Tax=Gloeocapsopsis dulcis AAB1 = 1H9 TaxID=1433147 RepID=A0A6N8FVX8_9CHRO|nr:efflux RND transporter periplasmic adaptor subunit [Gloeocapsopsis dulcis]MUL37019.1 efflux transporter periplasmic adaptor subunit [Gloeocapsopsis dulcis AAB1 = 1H9]WNN87872.1 efflux RND transporter periplasmic adaptor subunit [Gloeocapsopsis dulcis]
MAQSNSDYPRVPEQTPDESPPRTKLTRSRSKRRNRWIAIISAVILLTGLGFGWRWWVSSRSGAEGSAAGQPQGIPVRLETLETTTVENATDFIGSLESQRAVTLRPEVTGRISRILVNPGDRVSVGTSLIQLRPDQQQANLASVQASVNSARAIRANAQSQIEALEAEHIAQQAEVELQEEEFQRISTLVNQGALPRQQLDSVVRDRRTAQANLNAINRRIQAARASLQETEAGLQQAQANAQRATAELQETTIAAPFGGIVGDIPVRLGDVVTSSDTLTTVTQNTALELRLSIPLERAPDLRQGQQVELTDTQGAVISTGKISFIAPRVDPNAQSILAKATFSNQEERLRDGQFVRARVIWSERPGILIPTTAITRLAGEPFVFVAETPPVGGDAPSAAQEGTPAPKLIAQQRPVELGSLQGNSYQVLSGVEPGEQVVVSGILNLMDGAPIIPDTAMTQPPGANVSHSSSREATQ